MLSYLKGAAINWFEPGLMDPTNSAYWMWDFPTFINKLESNFIPHDPIGDAKKALTELTMREHSCTVKYNVDFWKLVSKLDWNESTLCTCYFCGLPLHLRTEVLCGSKPTTLAALHLKVQDADEIYRMMKLAMRLRLLLQRRTINSPTTTTLNLLTLLVWKTHQNLLPPTITNLVGKKTNPRTQPSWVKMVDSPLKNGNIASRKAFASIVEKRAT